MCLIFVGIVGKYPQSVLTGDSCVQFLIQPDCRNLKVNVFSASNMSGWDVGVNGECIIQTEKKFDETTRGWDLNIKLKPQTGQPQKLIVYAKKPEEDNDE